MATNSDKHVASIPIVGKTYTHYDDGKIKESRAYNVKITEVIPFDAAPKELIDLWNACKNEDRQYDLKILDDVTDYFIKGIDLNDGKTEYIYARSLWTYNKIVNGWFSFNYDILERGRLDVEGNLMKLWWM